MQPSQANSFIKQRFCSATFIQMQARLVAHGARKLC